MAIFPEGTRRTKGLVKKHQARPHTGAARVALEAGVPLIPAAISGTDRITRLGLSAWRTVRRSSWRTFEIETCGRLRRSAPTV